MILTSSFQHYLVLVKPLSHCQLIVVGTSAGSCLFGDSNPFNSRPLLWLVDAVLFLSACLWPTHSVLFIYFGLNLKKKTTDGTSKGEALAANMDAKKVWPLIPWTLWVIRVGSMLLKVHKVFTCRTRQKKTILLVKKVLNLIFKNLFKMFCSNHCEPNFLFTY